MSDAFVEYEQATSEGGGPIQVPKPDAPKLPSEPEPEEIPDEVAEHYPPVMGSCEVEEGIGRHWAYVALIGAAALIVLFLTPFANRERSEQKKEEPAAVENDSHIQVKEVLKKVYVVNPVDKKLKSQVRWLRGELKRVKRKARVDRENLATARERIRRLTVSGPKGSVRERIYERHVGEYLQSVGIE